MTAISMSPDPTTLRIAIAHALGIAYDPAPHDSHVWITDDGGDVERFELPGREFHSGPCCARCGYTFCAHCDPASASGGLPCVARMDFPDWPHSLDAAAAAMTAAAPSWALEHIGSMFYATARGSGDRRVVAVHPEAAMAVSIALLSWLGR